MQSRSMGGLGRCLAIGLIWQLLVDFSLAYGLATVTPCPECGPSIAPAPITITAQYQTIPTCHPSTTTVFATHTKRHTTKTSSTVETVAECSDYAWVSTTIPAYKNGSKISTIVTTTNQPVTFNSQHYTETHTTIEPNSKPAVAGSKGLYYNGTYHNATTTPPSSTTKTSFTTIDVKSYCDYDDIGPLAIPEYGGSGLCTDCGPDSNSAVTQRFTVVLCSDAHCTTFNETWIASPMTYHSSKDSQPVTVTVTTTNTYCPTATPVTAIPGYGHPSQTGSSTSTAASAAVPAENPTTTLASPTPYASQPGGSSTSPPTSPEGYHQPSGNSNNPSPPMSSSNENSPPGAYPQSASQSSTNHSTTAPTATHPYNSSPPSPTAPGYSDSNPNPTPTNPYDDGNGSPDPSADPSGGMNYDQPAPTPYQRRDKYKVFRRQGLEKPRGKVMRRSGLLFWGT